MPDEIVYVATYSSARENLRILSALNREKMQDALKRLIDAELKRVEDERRKVA